MEYGASQQGGTGGTAAVRRLRPLDVGQKLDVAVALSMREFWTLVRAVLLVLVPITVLSFLITVSTLPDDFTTGGFAGGTTSSDDSAGFVVGQLLVQFLQWLALFLAPVVCFRTVARAYLGEERAGWWESVRAMLKRFWSALLIAIVVSVVLFVAFLVGIFVIALTVAIFPWFALASIPAVFLGMAWIVVIWSLALPALLFEEIGPFAALGRSYTLVKESWWHTFATLLMASLLALFVAAVTAGVLLAVTYFTLGESSMVAIVLEFLANLIASALTAPFLAAAMVVVYFDRRVRREALDLELVVNATAGRPASEALVRKRMPVPVAPPPPGWGAAPGGWGQPQAPAPAWGQPVAPAPAWGQPAPPAGWGQPAPPPAWEPPTPPDPPDRSSS